MRIGKVIPIVVVLLSCLTSVFGQTRNDRLIKSQDSLIKHQDSVISKHRTSLKTDVLPEIFQAAINNGIVSSSAKSVKLNTTIYGLKKLFDSTIKVDTNYIKQRFNRNFALGAGISIDNTNKINGINGSFKYAIINNRDLSDYYHLSKKENKIRDSINLYDTSWIQICFSRINKIIEDSLRREGNHLNATDINQAQVKFTNSGETETDFKAFIQELISDKIIIDTAIFSKYHAYKYVDSLSNHLITQINKGSLLTFSTNGSYTNSWDSIFIQLEYLKGLGWEKDSTKPWDIYAGAFYNFKMDTISKQPLQRQIFSLKFGLNKVLATKSDGSPLFEILGAGELDDITNKLYPKESQYYGVADFTFTIKVSNSVSVPLEIKYNPTGQGNFYGFLNLKWDILTSPSK